MFLISVMDQEWEGKGIFSFSIPVHNETITQVSEEDMDNAIAHSDEMKERIREKKIELQRLVLIYGFGNSKVLKCSEELDLLIYQMQLDKQRVKLEFFANGESKVND